MRLVTQILGVNSGDFRPAHHTKETLAKKIQNVIRNYFLPEPTSIFAPSAGFSNRVATFSEEEIDAWSSRLYRTNSIADGAIILSERKAIAFFNADCPIICLYRPSAMFPMLAVLHGGFRCLVREDHAELNIIENAMQPFPMPETFAWVGYGIGPCCWVPEEDKMDELINPEESQCPDTLRLCVKETNLNSPFGPGKVSVDLFLLAKKLLIKAGVPEENITIDSKCTCCVKENDEYSYWSHNRYRANMGGYVDGRNMSLAFLDWTY